MFVLVPRANMTPKSPKSSVESSCVSMSSSEPSTCSRCIYTCSTRNPPRSLASGQRKWIVLDETNGGWPSSDSSRAEKGEPRNLVRIARAASATPNHALVSAPMQPRHPLAVWQCHAHFTKVTRKIPRRFQGQSHCWNFIEDFFFVDFIGEIRKQGFPIRH